MALPIITVIRIEGHQFAKRKAESQRPTFQKWEEQGGPKKEKERCGGGAKNSGDDTKRSSI